VRACVRAGARVGAQQPPPPFSSRDRNTVQMLHAPRAAAVDDDDDDDGVERDARALSAVLDGVPRAAKGELI